MANEQTPTDTKELLALIDRLEVLLQASQLSEIEVEAGGTALVLRTPAAVAPPLLAATPAATQAAADSSARSADEDDGPRTMAVLAPLTGLFYMSPSPDSDPYVREGSEVHVGQVIGLIEAMKLFNEIKSDADGSVVRNCVDDGGLVKAKQPLIELAPL